MSAKNQAKESARAVGLKTFFDGVPCPRGHIGERRTSNSECLTCAREAARDRASAKRDAARVATGRARRLKMTEEQRAARTRERQKINQRKWDEKNREKIAAKASRRRARVRGNSDFAISDEMAAAWSQEQPKVCFYCGADCRDDFHVDHFIPVARGGAHVLTNFRVACGHCNRRKGARDPAAWMEMASCNSQTPR